MLRNIIVCLWLLSGSVPAASASQVPGAIIYHSAASTGVYVGSPGIVALPDGSYCAKCDLFGPGSTKNKTGVTLVFASEDRGKTWKKTARVEGMFWSSIFLHKGALYMFGPNRRYGSLVIRKSVDGGATWSTPKDKHSGLLTEDEQYHTAPVPIVAYKNRLWRAAEDRNPPTGWGRNYRAFVMSVSVDADLLEASNWRFTNRVRNRSSWLDGKFGGWLEGNVVIGPKGGIFNILRVHNPPEGGKAAVVSISSDGRTASFDPARDIIGFPGGCKKFTIRYDPQTKKYWTLSNPVLPRHAGGNPERTRNAVALMASKDLRSWEIRSIVLYHEDVHHHGFQYLDWRFEKADIIAASRTAYDDGEGGAHNQHDANYLTFHRFKEFRTLRGSVAGAK